MPTLGTESGLLSSRHFFQVQKVVVISRWPSIFDTFHIGTSVAAQQPVSSIQAYFIAT
jgi:hypothetical protein